MLWEELTRRIWSPQSRRRFPSWQNEFRFHHRRFSNFRRGVYHGQFYKMSFSSTCRHLVITDYHLAAGFEDGMVFLFDLRTRLTCAQYLIRIFNPCLSCVADIILLEHQLIFSYESGDIFAASITYDDDIYVPLPARQVRIGVQAEDEIMLSFTGDRGQWIGFFMSFNYVMIQAWNAETEQVVHTSNYFSCSSNSIRAVMAEPGVVHICFEQEIVVAGLEELNVLSTFYIEHLHMSSHYAFGARDGRVVVAGRCDGKVREARTSRELCNFDNGSTFMTNLCSLNMWFVVLWSKLHGKIFDAETGEELCLLYFDGHIYDMLDDFEDVQMIATNDRYMVVWIINLGLYFWDFGAN